MKKRVISLLLALTLCLGLLPAPAFAQETEPTQVTEAPTEAPATEAPATEAPAAEPTPAPTEALAPETTVAPAPTEAPTEAPATEAPATEAPAAEPTPAPTEAPVPETTVAPASTEVPAEPASTEDEAVAAVQAMIDALPDVDHMSEEYIDALEEAYSAYETLSESQQAQITGVEKLEALFGWVNSQVSTLADDVMDISGEKTWDNQTFNTPVKLTGETTLTLVGDNKIECEKPLDLNGHKLTIQGNGSLELVGSNNDGNYYNSGTIYDSTWTGTSYTGGGMVIESGTVIARADVYNAVAVRYLYMDGGKLEAYGARAGIVTTDLQIKDGSLYATGNSKCGINMYSAPRAVSVNGLNILVSNEPNAQDANMEDGTTKQIEDSEKKTVAIGKFSTSPSISVQPQQGYLYEATAKTATFALSGRNVDLSAALTLEWTGTHTGLTESLSDDGKTLTVTTDATVKQGTYSLTVTVTGTDGTQVSKTVTVTVLGAPITVTTQPKNASASCKRGDLDAWQGDDEVLVAGTLAAGLTDPITYQWKLEDDTVLEGFNQPTIKLADLYTANKLTPVANKSWLLSAKVYCTLTVGSYNVDTDPVTLTVNTCAHERANPNGNCQQCGEPCSLETLLVSGEGTYHAVDTSETGTADVGSFLTGGGIFYLTKDVKEGTIKAGNTMVASESVTLDLQKHTLNKLDMGNFPYGSFTLKDGTLNQLLYSDSKESELILEDMTFPQASAAIPCLKIIIKGDTVFKENVYCDVEGGVLLQGGTFEKGIVTGGGVQPLALLDEGYAFQNARGIVDASIPENLSGKTIQVVAHTCKYVNGKCECGRSCAHETVNADGYCTVCQALVEPYAIGQTRYKSLEAALDAANAGDTITLRGNFYQGAATVEINKPVTLDLDGHTLTSDADGEPVLRVLAENVTIRNGTVENTRTAKSSPAVTVGQTSPAVEAGLTVKSVTFIGSSDGNAPQEDALDIQNGHAKVESGIFNGGIFAQGDLTMTDGSTTRLELGYVMGTIQLSGGSFDSIHFDADADYLGLLAEGYAYQSGTGMVKLADMNDSTAVQVVKCTHPDGLTADTACPYCGKKCGHENTSKETGLCPDCGYQMAASLTVDGNTTFFNTFPEAVTAANGKTGALLTLLKDVVKDNDDQLTFESGEITVNWNGHTLSSNSWSSVIALNGAELTLRDSSGKNAGGIANQKAGAIYVSGGSLTIESGTYASRVFISVNTASVKISDGAFKNDPSSSYTYAIDTGGSRYLAELMAPGYTLALDPEGEKLIDMYTSKHTPEHTNVYVVPHASHTFDENGKCACGAAASAQVVAGTESIYYGDFESAVNKAMTLSGSTVRLLKDVTHSGDSGIYIDGGTFTIDWNGHTLSGSFWGNLLTISQSANVTLQNSDTNTGGARQTGKGAAVRIAVGSEGRVNILGGTYSPNVTRAERCYGSVQISGGVFKNPKGYGQTFALYDESGRPLSGMLAPDTAFAYEADGSKPLNAYAVSQSDSYKTVYAVAHTHENWTDGVCDCGYPCPHDQVDEAGDCILCGKRFYVQGTYVNGTTHYYGTLSDALGDSAVTKAVIIRSFVPVCESWDGGDRSVTLDLNYFGAVIKSVRSGHLILRDSSESGSILEVKEIQKDGQVTVESGTVFPQGENPSVYVYGKLTVTGGYVGSLTAMEGSTVSLSGGSFGKIAGSGVTLRSLLAEDRYYAELDGETPRNYADTDTVIEGVSVVVCDHTSVRENKGTYFSTYTCNCGKVTYLLTVTVGESDKKYFGDYNTGFAYAAKSDGVVRFLTNGVNGTIEVNAQGTVTIDMENRSYSAGDRSLVIKSGSTVRLVGRGSVMSTPEPGSGSSGSSGTPTYNVFIPVKVESGGTFVLPAKELGGGENMAKLFSLTVQSGGTAELQGGSTDWTYVYGNGTLHISGGNHGNIHQYDQGQLNITGGDIKQLQIYGDLPRNALSGGSYGTISAWESNPGESETGKLRNVTFDDFQNMLASGKVFQNTTNQSYPNQVETDGNYGFYYYKKDLSNVCVTAAPFTGVQVVCQIGEDVHTESFTTVYGGQEEDFFLKARLLSPAAKDQSVTYQWYQVQDGSKTEVGKGETYQLKQPVNVGVYTYQVTASFNGYELTSAPFTVTVGKAPQTADVEAHDETVSGKNDGYVTLKPQVSAYEMRKPGEETFTPCEGNGTDLPLPAGTYELRMKETEIYEASDSKTVTVRPGPKLTVTMPESTEGYTLTANKTALDWKENLELTLTLEQKYYRGITFAVTAGDTKLSELQSGVFTLDHVTQDVAITVEGILLDDLAPFMSIKNGENQWYTFEDSQPLYTKAPESNQFTFWAVDSGSGLKEMWYCFEKEELDRSQMETLTWNPVEFDSKNGGYTSAVLTREGEYYLYGKALDNVGNVTYVRTGKLIRETQAPTFTGPANGSDCYVTQKIKISDNYLVDRIRLSPDDEKPVGTKDTEITLPGDQNKTYTVTAWDACGNTSTYTVIMKPMDDLTREADALQPDSIQKADLETLDLVEAALKALDLTDATEKEKVTVEEKLEYIWALRQVLDGVEAVETRLKALPEQAQPYSETLEDSQILPARKAFDALTAHQKSLVEAALVQKLETLESELKDFQITQGDGQTWNKGSKTALQFTVAGQMRKFRELLINGTTLDNAAYAVSAEKDQPMILTLPPEYLQGLEAGQYTLEVRFTQGATPKAAFTVEIPHTYLDVTDGELAGNTTVTVNGESYPVEELNGESYVNLPENGGMLTANSYAQGAESQNTDNYPTGMRVYRITREETGAKLERVYELDDLLQYAGCSIRLNGTKGIRMITSVDEKVKNALVNASLAGFTLEEYGTVVMRGVGTPTLETGSHNYAYKRGVNDPVFATVNGRCQYTNVLVGFSLEDCKQTLTLRPYIILKDQDGVLYTLYGGCVSRSIGYIAKQNENAFKPGTEGYRYVHEIINAVYGQG